MDVDNRIVLVTGGAKGIGRSIAHAFAKAGDQVVIADRDEAVGAETERWLLDQQLQAAFIRMDVSDPESITAAMAEIDRRFGRLDVLINNAGITVWKSPYELRVEEWDHVLNTNLRSVFLCSREAAKRMRTNGGGAIVNIASTRAHMSEPHTEAYAASKGGILALTHALALSLSSDRIRVNAISPGWIETGDYEALRAIDHEQHPAQRVGKPADIARACLFLAAPENDFVTGAEIVIDGGMTRKMIYAP
ncbi:glucose 1-dehydrogenase [Brevibacillus sp. SYP-B805]|uniref:SDR family NAD(P)-dependent oxidoreductase n=1 Tax=Brevibacillus sp. SYP-B805 TaxID=1578199 RepID=UPI0013EDC169|nr:glucose 1-dehydrogenase [Brevibacillus sp. SYP-B805]NGQ95881.1 glucose 1-dehydrogenase [Brevibacillus sp. SYP-B805]